MNFENTTLTFQECSKNKLSKNAVGCNFIKKYKHDII